MIVSSIPGCRTIGWLVLEWVTVFRRDTTSVCNQPFSLLPSMGREMSTGQSAVMFCGWEKGSLAHSIR